MFKNRQTMTALKNECFPSLCHPSAHMFKRWRLSPKTILAPSRLHPANALSSGVGACCVWSAAKRSCLAPPARAAIELGSHTPGYGDPSVPKNVVEFRMLNPIGTVSCGGANASEWLSISI